MLHLHGHLICSLFCLMWPFYLSPFSIRTSQPQRTKAPGTASRPWHQSCPLCLGSRRTGWSCTIRTGTHPLLTHLTHPRGIFRLKCEVKQTYTHSLEYTHAHAKIQRHTEMNFWKAIHKWFSAKISHTLLPVSTNVLCRIPYIFVYCGSGQTWKGDCSTLYFRKDYWKVRTGARNVCDWWKFFNELKKKYENLISEIKMSWFYSGEKRNTPFNCLMIWWGKGKEKTFLHRSVLFIARGRQCHQGFSHWYPP